MRLKVILVEPEHEGNIGSVARAMKNFGFDELCIVNPKTEITLHCQSKNRDRFRSEGLCLPLPRHPGTIKNSWDRRRSP